MTSIIRFTPLSGAQDEGPLCYLLQVDEFKFLLDCGWDENLSQDVIENIKRHAHSIDAVLLSHPDIYHLGALPYLIGKCNLNCPVYATIPVYKMGQMFLYDFYQSHVNNQDFAHYTLDEVDAAFDKIIQLKYSQHVSLKGRGHGLSITPYAAGHMIGGTMWKIMKEGEEDIIYAVDYNHKKEIHLNGAVLETLSRPALLITDSYAALCNQERRKERDIQLMNSILSALRQDGNVLLAVDTAGRILELMQLLDQMWSAKESGLSVYSLALLNNVSYNVVEFAKSQVEWMSDRMMKSFEVDRRNPFAFKHITLCHFLKELDQLPSPKVVLASAADMNCGFSKDLFVQWASNPKNSVIFTFKTSPGSLARTLIDNPKIESVELEVFKRVRLEGVELSQYLEVEKEKARQAKLQRKLTEVDVRQENVFKDESESEEEMEEENLNKSKYDLMITNEKLRHKSSFFKQAKIYPMFPFKEERLKWDDYGEIIRPEDYVIIENNLMEEEGPKITIEDMKEDLEALEIKEPPTKSVSEMVKVDVRCKISYIDFEGRSDGESVRRILSIVKPRQLILIHGSPAATEALSRYCQTSTQFNVSKVYTPYTNEMVDATRESHIYQVKLKDSLVSSLKFAVARDTELAWVDGQLVMEARGEKFNQIEQENSEKVEKQDVVPVLEQLPPEMIPGHATVFIDEPRLSDFKQVLTKAGIQAEFTGGVLVCNNVVAVRRGEQGKISIEGGLCEEYYVIRQLLYDQYAIV
ncbi:cleavage and polyadenylation specificity factor subunit 2 isoform X1 [Hydra vulgaris]|uniref:cleavage and polyadenylation specificity factor subunit 2 isoform X1 n=1 Tax=Hydra vulgaris TaxID=6087 RepID=UPI00064129C4|nr:cleavage and polyadenylation specificity factor subunit 2 [Hydra vulgaris]